MGLIPYFEFDEKNSHYQMWYGDDYVGSFSNVSFTKEHFQGVGKWSVWVPDKSYFIVDYHGAGKRWFFDVSKEKTRPQLMTNKWWNFFLILRDDRELAFFIIIMSFMIIWFVWADPFGFNIYFCFAKELVRFLFSCDFPGVGRPEYKKCFY